MHDKAEWNAQHSGRHALLVNLTSLDGAFHSALSCMT
jgi:hypothetical protein